MATRHYVAQQVAQLLFARRTAPCHRQGFRSRKQDQRAWNHSVRCVCLPNPTPCMRFVCISAVHVASLWIRVSRLIIKCFHSHLPSRRQISNNPIIILEFAIFPLIYNHGEGPLFCCRCWCETRSLQLVEVVSKIPSILLVWLIKILHNFYNSKYCACSDVLVLFFYNENRWCLAKLESEERLKLWSLLFNMLHCKTVVIIYVNPSTRQFSESRISVLFFPTVTVSLLLMWL